jgi:hypothetical protein
MPLIKREPKTWKTLDVLHSFYRYWLKSEELIAQDASVEEILNRPSWQPNPDDDSESGEYQAEVAAIRAFHDNTMTRILRYSCVALLYSLIEVELRRFIINLIAKPISPKPRQNYLDAFAQCLTSHSLDVEKLRQYASMRELKSVRDCIVHCWGDMNYVKPGPKTALLKLSNLQVKGILCLDKREIHIEKRFVSQKVADSWELFLQLFHRTKWRIDGEWLSKSFEEER